MVYGSWFEMSDEVFSSTVHRCPSSVLDLPFFVCSVRPCRLCWAVFIPGTTTKFGVCALASGLTG